MTTYTPRPRDIRRHWYVVDAEGQVLGRLATEIARILMGKHKPMWSPHMDCGDHVIVINAAKLHVTGNKLDQKIYYRHSGYPGGLRQRTLAEMLQRFPERVLETAIRRMLPKNTLGTDMLKKLRVYAGPEHEHGGQKPTVLRIVGRPGQPSGPLAVDVTTPAPAQTGQ